MPSLAALVYQGAQLNAEKLLTKPQFVQIGTKFCGLKEFESALLFDLFSSVTGQQQAEPRQLIAFLFAALFKSTVSSKRSKILANDLWPQQQQTFEMMLEQYVKTCSDLLSASLCVTNPQLSQVNVQQLKTEPQTQQALNLLFNMKELPIQSALQLSATVTQQASCPAQPTE